MKIGVLFVFVFLLSFVSASSVTCTIVDDRVLVEVKLSDEASVVLPEKYSLLEEDGNSVSFISRNFIRKDGEWIFVLPVVVDSAYRLEVVLPSGSVLSQLDSKHQTGQVDGLVYPRGYELGSDGRSIILEWENVSEEAIVFYDDAQTSYVWVWVLIIGMMGLGLGFFWFQKRKFNSELKRLRKVVKDKNKTGVQDISYNLFGEEKRIVEFLARKKVCWMKDLVRELGLSKVMVTRKVRGLIEKRLVDVEKMGREMRIRLRKGK